MNAERWQQLDDLFQRSSELDSSERAVFLSEACGDDLELQNSVERWLANADKTLGFLRAPVHAAARELTFIGRRIGSYVLLRVLGEGGMGKVFLAERADEQYQQFVAIKLMHSGLMSPRPSVRRRFNEQSGTMLQRFQHERQILANLSHPNIARLLDGGMTSDGSPYLVMELVDGTPIDEHCREKRLSIKAKLELFRRVCLAVEYAHKNLVVHRDIKPANVLVTEEGTPKLLDFGIAKLLNPASKRQILPKTRLTERLMTPEYASPEQLRGESITTATDVYALGVLLYELLAGGHPFAEQTSNPVEMARQICEMDPRPPSAVALRSPDHADSAVRELKGDLDHIVLRAMRKEPERRYSSAAELAADVSAYLNGYPLIARNNSWGYRARKFVSRHKLAAIAVMLLALSLIGFSGAMAVLTQRANQERLRAEKERLSAEREATFLADMFRAATPAEARGRTVTARELLDRGASRVDKELASEPMVRASLLYAIADAYGRLGLYDQAQKLAERSFKLRAQSLGLRNPSTAESLYLVANVTRSKGEYERAEPLFRQALSIRQMKFGADSTVVADSLSNLGNCLYLEGKDTEAESKLRQALGIYRRHSANSGSAARDYLALLLEKKGEYLESTQLLHEAVKIDERTTGTDSPAYTMHLHNLAGALARLGDLFTAETKLRESLRTERRVLGDAHPNLGYSLNLLGQVLLEEGDWRQAEPVLRESLALWSKLGQTRLATGLSNWARVLQAQGKYDDARQYFERALVITEQQSKTDALKTTRILSKYALLEFDSGQYSRSEELARRALKIQRAMRSGETAPDTAWTIITLAEARVFQGDAASAEPLLRAALMILKTKLPPGYPPITSAEVRLGEALTAAGKPAAAEPILRHALASAYAPPFRIPAWQVGEAESAFGWCLHALGQTREAQRLLQLSQNKLVSDPRPIYRKQASAHLKALQATS
ncbi:MAG: tetratricopeptide repeat protein [Acidobacteriaceae bacterium]|nr:tetratricopeptide repeat protein [Acidobacteriaceae bacterium]